MNDARLFVAAPSICYAISNYPTCAQDYTAPSSSQIGAAPQERASGGGTVHLSALRVVRIGTLLPTAYRARLLVDSGGH
jgi:hypothetical protein